MRLKSTLSFILGIIVIMTLFFVPGLLQPNDSTVCLLPKTSAQDVAPCLAQEATISALQYQVLQAQSTTVALQSTLIALETSPSGSQSSDATNVAIHNGVLPFVEDFSSNQNGWDLSSDDFGAVRISQGELLVSSAGSTFKTATVPEISVGDDFYVQVDVTPLQSGMTIALVIGDTGARSWHTFGIYAGSRVQFFDGDTLLFDTTYKNGLWESNKKFVLGVEALSGLYTLYVNDKATDSFQIAPHGQSVALGVWNGSSRFDNLVIRSYR